MATVYSDHANANTSKKSKTVTPQSAPIKGREAEMKRNDAGGFTFVLDNWGQLDRFIMIGSESGSYHVGQKDLTKANFAVVEKCIKEDGVRAVQRAVEYSTSGRAPKNDPALVVLALAAAKGSSEVQAAAYEALPKVARTGTHLFTFVSILNSLGKWNAAAKRGVSNWYTGKTEDQAALQVLKYQSRNGWSHRDVLRLAHVKPQNELQSSLLRYVVKGADGLELGAAVPQLLVDFERLKRATSTKEVLTVLASNPKLTWEMVPTQFLRDKQVMAALVPNMGMTALIRQLGRLSSIDGLFGRLSEMEKIVCAKINDADAIKRQRVHPLTLLQAIKQYAAGKGEKGSLSWNTNKAIVDALNDAFYASFSLAEKVQDNYYIGVDCSGSMFGSQVNGSPNLTAAEVAGVMALAIAHSAPHTMICGFGHNNMGELAINTRMRLDAVMEKMRRFSWGGTDCALPFVHAQQSKIPVDRFVVITDNETWAGRIQPVEALRNYRKAMNRPAKSVVIGTEARPFTIADPKDSGMLDIAGFDTAAPQIIRDF